MTKVYLAEYYPTDYDAPTEMIGIFETYEIAWEAIRETIKEKNDRRESTGQPIYQVGEFGVIGFEMNQRLNISGKT